MIIEYTIECGCGRKLIQRIALRDAPTAPVKKPGRPFRIELPGSYDEFLQTQTPAALPAAMISSRPGGGEPSKTPSGGGEGSKTGTGGGPFDSGLTVIFGPVVLGCNDEDPLGSGEPSETKPGGEGRPDRGRRG
jgi:hypothetical protein